MGGFRTDERIPQQGRYPFPPGTCGRGLSGAAPAGGFQSGKTGTGGTAESLCLIKPLSHAEVQTPPEGDKFDDLLALGRQFGNFTVK